MPKAKCACVYATSANTASVRSGHEMGGYLKKECEVCKTDRLKAEASRPKGNYRPGTPLNEILKDCWARSFTMEQTLQEVEGMGFKVDASLVTWFNGQWDADFQREMSRQGRVDKLMEQAQVFASAWASVDGPFNTGTMLALAEQERENLRKMILEGDRG